MELRTIHIKQMCCQRCIEAVEGTLSNLGLDVKNVQLGIAVFVQSEKVSDELISSAIVKRGFEIIKSEDERLTGEIKISIMGLIHHASETENDNKNIRAYLEKVTLKPFRVLNKVFVNTTQITIQKYTILQRIEKVKALISESKFNFSEIAFLTGYKTPQHLSAQFKKYEGISMLDYKASEIKNRNPIDKI
ncbi:hypothetical protein CJD36_019110 [Flavipsychrobacter stenotrophus]|uniref:HTH araC/xylS-type domain-containing protein n=1 Tax=Flavipsychrobacter stenotrophus TaxID=2077091 RepID=A0A2S7SR33_9BACT|nr:helix-turn-helix domain-containing protein [Flavipsychrobacter stenotrophus]PQJ09359.1 hypothetical protein CJD36_019110 [Flavipsychrobacter stenotrophus]